MCDILKFLEDREKRVDKLKKLKKEYNAPCIFVRANYPGINKSNEVTKGIVSEMFNELNNLFLEDILYKEFGENAEGPYGIFLIKDNVKEIKLKALLLEEEHFLGRLVDIDAYDVNNDNSISRSDLGKKKRKCYLCDDYAHLCVRSKKHSVVDVKQFIEDKWSEYNK